MTLAISQSHEGSNDEQISASAMPQTAANANAARGRDGKAAGRIMLIVYGALS